MTSNQQNLLELAKQGNSMAIAALINRSLRPKGITAKVNLKGNSLQILVESDKALDQELITQFLVRGIKQLNIKSIDSIKVFGKQSGQDFPDWTQDIPLQNNSKEALPDLWLKLYWMIHFAFLAFAEGLAVPRY